MKSKVLIIAILFLGVSACKKKGCTDETAENYSSSAVIDDGSCTYAAVPTAASPAPVFPSYTGEYAALVGIKTVTTATSPIGSFDTELGTAVAVFSQDGGVSYLPAGTITASSKTLALGANNTYTYTPSVTDLTGIDFSSSLAWSGTGGTWPSFSATTNVGFSSIQVISSGDVAVASNYDLVCGGITNADSVYFAVYGPSGSKLVLLPGNTTSHTFTAADLTGMGTGTGFVQVTGIKYDPQVIGGKTYYLINETVRTKQVKFN